MTVIQATTGRKIEYTYDGVLGVWIPRRSYGTVALYVDPLGTDDLDHGFAAGANAFQTLQYAWDSLPDILDHRTTIDGTYSAIIYVSSGTYIENLLLRRNDTKAHVLIVGTLTNVSDHVATGGVQGAGANPPSCSGAFVAGAGEGQLCHFTSGANNDYRLVIGKTNVGNMYYAGPTLAAAPINGDTFSIENWGSIINGNTRIWGNSYLDFRNIQFSTVAGDYGVEAWQNTKHIFENCKFYNNNLTAYTVVEAQVGNGIFRNCYWLTAGNRISLSVENLGTVYLQGGKMEGPGGGNGVGVYVRSNSAVQQIYGFEITGFMYAGDVITNATIWASVGNVNIFYHGNAVGLIISRGGQYYNLASNTYGTELDGVADPNTVANTQVDAATFGCIS